MQPDSNGALRGHIYFNYYSHYHCTPSSLTSTSSNTHTPLLNGNIKRKKIEDDCFSPTQKGHTPSLSGVKAAFDLRAHYRACLTTVAREQTDK